MSELKVRLNAVKSMAPHMVYGATTVFEQRLHAEMACLQLRKVLELIIYSNLVAHRERFEAKRAEFAQLSRAKRVLERMARMNPHFFPVPFDIANPTGEVHNFEPYEGDEALKVEEVAPLFDAVSLVAHVLNPLKQVATISLGRPLSEWVLRIERLMARHIVRLSNRHVLVVQLHGPDGHVQVANGEADGGVRWPA